MDVVTVKSIRSVSTQTSEKTSKDGSLNLRTTSNPPGTIVGPIAVPEDAENPLESIIGIFKDEPLMETLMDSIRENRRSEIEANAPE